MISNDLDAAAFSEIHYFKTSLEYIDFKWVLNSTITFINNINEMRNSPGGSGNYLFTKSSWKLAGRYNESVGGAWDSWAFACAQLASGAKFKTLPNSFYFHRHGYESTFVKDNRKLNESVNLARILVPYFNLIHPDDVDYILNRYYRHSWLRRIENRKIRSNNTIESLRIKIKIKNTIYRIAEILSGGI